MVNIQLNGPIPSKYRSDGVGYPYHYGRYTNSRRPLYSYVVITKDGKIFHDYALWDHPEIWEGWRIKPFHLNFTKLAQHPEVLVGLQLLYNQHPYYHYVASEIKMATRLPFWGGSIDKQYADWRHVNINFGRKDQKTIYPDRNTHFQIPRGLEFISNKLNIYVMDMEEVAACVEETIYNARLSDWQYINFDTDRLISPEGRYWKRNQWYPPVKEVADILMPRIIAAKLDRASRYQHEEDERRRREEQYKYLNRDPMLVRGPSGWVIPDLGFKPPYPR